MEENYIAVLGGDARSFYLTEALEKELQGWRILSAGNPLCKNRMQKEALLLEIPNCSIVVLPVPCSVDGRFLKWGAQSDPIALAELGRVLQKGQTVFGGAFRKDFLDMMQEKGITVIDFMKINGVAVKNAVATAEGAIANAVLEMPGNLEESGCLVLGYGICGKEIARRLGALASKVMVMARRAQVRREIEEAGFQALPMFADLESMPQGIDVVFNTIPSLVIDKRAVDMLGESAVIIDIASSPGGTDFDYCREKGVKAGLYLGIPGKYAPKKSGEILAAEVTKYIGGADAKSAFAQV